jgi:hypothetical protein
MPGAVQRLLVGSAAVPGSSGESAARAGLPERRCSGYLLMAWLFGWLALLAHDDTSQRRGKLGTAA